LETYRRGGCEVSATPACLESRLQRLLDVVDSLRPLRHIPSMKTRFADAEELLAAMRDVERRVTMGDAKRKYTDEAVRAVVESGLPDGACTMDHVALASELYMNVASLMYFVKMREFCLGGAWVNTHDRVMVMVADGDDDALADMRERNRLGLAEYEAGKLERGEET
jgi:hypothetical protein